jgi:sugar/nucleoside kinase (ribokinase family)
MHGIACARAAAEIAEFSNRVGALVASVHGAIPNWTMQEVVDL